MRLLRLSLFCVTVNSTISPNKRVFMLTQAPSYTDLLTHFSAIQTQSMLDWFAANPKRVSQMSVQAADLHLDFSKQRIDNNAFNLLVRLAKERDVPAKIAALLAGETVNSTEMRPALHTALRQTQRTPLYVNGQDITKAIRATLDKMQNLYEKVQGGVWKGFTNQSITDVVSIGIGGSFLGPKVVSNALTPYANTGIKVHYLANIDGSHFTQVVSNLNPERTLFIVQSKSFSTQETLNNALACRAWLQQAGCLKTQLQQHFLAVTANNAKAIEFGIAEENLLPMWDWVGGRYSLWSAIGLPLVFEFGFTHFKALLAGAEKMDQHFAQAPLAKNMPVIMALLGIWYINFYGIKSQCILPYDHYLRVLPAHLQQLEMESNGKSVLTSGEIADYHTGAVIWGAVGTNGQHAFHQLLHQGTEFIPCDFILPLRSHNPVGNFHAMLVANCLSQSQALLQGKSLAQVQQELIAQGVPEASALQLAAHKQIAGNRPSSTLYFTQLTPATLGALLALYEHKVAVQGMLWGINSFDQWGVELGKELGNCILPLLGQSEHLDSQDLSTQHLIKAYNDAQCD